MTLLFELGLIVTGIIPARLLLEFLCYCFYNYIFKNTDKFLKISHYFYMEYLFLKIKHFYFNINDFLYWCFTEFLYFLFLLVPYLIYKLTKRCFNVLLLIVKTPVLNLTFFFKACFFIIPRILWKMYADKRIRYIIASFYKDSLLNILINKKVVKNNKLFNYIEDLSYLLVQSFKVYVVYLWHVVLVFYYKIRILLAHISIMQGTPEWEKWTVKNFLFNIKNNMRLYKRILFFIPYKKFLLYYKTVLRTFLLNSRKKFALLLISLHYNAAYNYPLRKARKLKRIYFEYEDNVHNFYKSEQKELKLIILTCLKFFWDEMRNYQYFAYLRTFVFIFNNRILRFNKLDRVTFDFMRKYTVNNISLHLDTCEL